MKYLFLLVLISGMSACQSTPPEIDYDQMARELCACMQPMIDKNQEVMRVVREGQPADAERLMKEIETTGDAAEACATGVEARYARIDSLDDVRMTAAFEQHCPQMREMINGGSATQ